MKKVLLGTVLMCLLNSSSVFAGVSKEINIKGHQVVYSASNDNQVKDIRVNTYATIDFQDGYKTYCYLRFDLTSIENSCGLLPKTGIYVDDSEKPLQLTAYSISENTTKNKNGSPKYSSHIYYETKSDRELKKIASAKKVTVCFIFRERAPIEWQIQEDLLMEWKEIFSKDKDAELKKID
ncbi:hypothetical protein [Azotosporobacter soli]|uniref:hypothetical protein n=1 Tax=Azotosporobacter soli TaxID=3055040 RepID=UPI0031FEC970